MRNFHLPLRGLALLLKAERFQCPDICTETFLVDELSECFSNLGYIALMCSFMSRTTKYSILWERLKRFSQVIINIQECYICWLVESSAGNMQFCEYSKGGQVFGRNKGSSRDHHHRLGTERNHQWETLGFSLRFCSTQDPSYFARINDSPVWFKQQGSYPFAPAYSSVLFLDLPNYYC